MKKAKSSTILISVFAIILVIGASYLVYLNYVDNKYSTLIYPGVSIESLDLSGLSKTEAADKIKSSFIEPLEEKKIVITTPIKSYELSYDDISASLNTDEALNKAFNYGKDLNLIKRVNLINSHPAYSIDINFNFDSTPIDNLVATIEGETNRESSNAVLNRVSYGNFSVTPSVTSLTLRKDELKDLILSKIARDAEEEVSLEAPITEDAPEITTDTLNKVNSKISSYTTKMDNVAGRNHNIALSTSYIQGTLLLPGQEFSFNNVVGNTTPDKGYKPANVIVDNKIKEDYGGGICQVSSTLFNSVIRAGIPATEIHHHTLPSCYVPLGLDVTIDYGNADYKFVNTLDCPIYIEGYTTPSSVTFEVFSDSSLLDKSYDFESKTVETIPLKTENLYDPTLAKGSNKIEVIGTPGYRVEVYKLIKDGNGNVVNRELSYKHFYEPVTRVIKYNK